jgi:hypothetical protein
METRKEIEALIGKHGFLKIPERPEIGFTYLAVEIPPEFPAGTDLSDFGRRQT